MIKNILWDFDGVILDSMKIKGDGFLELFKEYDDTKVKLLEEYHYKNGGMSRFNKIKYFFKSIINESISEEQVNELAILYGKLVKKKLLNKNNLIEDSLNFIKENYKTYNFHIVSGAEENELNEICRYFEIDKYFLTISGSPIKKDILIKKILTKYIYNKEETILIGDSINDYIAASKNSIKFLGYNNPNLKLLSNYINKFKGIQF